MSPVAAPGIYARTAEGKILFAMPGCTHWNTCIAQRRKG